MARLLLLTPMPELPQRFTLNKERVSLGREVDNDIVLPHPTVSRHHAVIARQTDGLCIEDLGSSNGTFHNGDRIERAWLRTGDRLFIGKLEFKIEDDQVDFFAKLDHPGVPSNVEKTHTMTVYNTRPDRRKYYVYGAAALLLILAGLAWLYMEQQTPKGRRSIVGR